MYTAPQSPQSIGGVIDSAIRLFKAGFRQCWTAALVVSLVSMVTSIWLQEKMQAVTAAAAGGGDPANVLAAMSQVFASPGVWGAYLVVIAVSIVFNLMITSTMVDIAQGREGGSALSRMGSMLALVPAAIGVGLVIGLASFIGFIFLIVPGLYLMVRWVLFSCAYTERRGGAFAALGTSWELVGGNWWRTLVIVSVVGIVVLLLVLVLGVVAGFIAAASGQDQGTRMLISQVLQGFAQVLYVPAITASLVAIYQDLKLRKGGADLEARLGNAGVSQA